MGLDRSGQLVSICGQRGLEACVSDVLTLPLRSDVCDAAVCIAVIHHFSTQVDLSSSSSIDQPTSML